MKSNLRGLAAISAAVLFVVGTLFLFIQPPLHLSKSIGIPITVQTPPVQIPQPGIFEAETRDALNVTRYTRRRLNATSDLLWLSLTHDKESWGRNRLRWTRTIDDFLKIVPAQHDVETVTLGLLTSSMDEYHKYKSATLKLPFAKVEIFFHPGFHDGPTVDRSHRHDDEVQAVRRAEIALLRNYLMLKTLGEEAHILWVDADIFHLDDGITKRMLQHIHDREEVGIITARCSRDGAEDYDRNAWRGTRKGPRGWDLDQKEINNGELKTQGQYHVDKLIVGTTDDDLVDLDTVGATILFLRASLVWRGLSFPHQFVIGTRWRKDGWDGIESEGLCYRARGLSGGKCAVLGGDWHIKHTDY